MTSRRFPAAPIFAFLLLFASFAAAAGEAPRATSEPAPPPLHGWVDMHAHPMAHLGFGGKLLHGAPDLGIVMSAIPSGSICRTWDVPLTREEASREDRAIHGGFGLFDNRCGDTLRKEFIRGLEGSLGAQSAHQEEGAFGFPDYNLFPAHNDLTHQQMWIDWVRRAWEGGLRVMVALAVNNRTVAAAVMGPGDINGDDVASADIQIEQMKVLVGQTSWMEIATTPDELRQIVGEGKLAIVLGVEIDNPGNMQWNPTVQPSADPASRTFIQSELQALWDADVRYIFPVHVVDNKFGGTAIYQDQFNLSNFHQTGEFWDIGCAEVGSGITHEFEVGGFDLAYEIIKLKIGIPGATPPPPMECDGPQHSGGHVNATALTPLGEFAIGEMMRLGMLIDVDHMSTAAVQRTLEIAEPLGFPVNAGHNAPRFGPWAEGNENEKTDEDYATIAALGGMIGLGSGSTASQFVETYQYVNPTWMACSSPSARTRTAS